MFANTLRLRLLVLAGIWLSLAFANAIVQAQADVIYSQPPSPGGGLFPSSRNPGGTDYDQYVWDNFTLQASPGITITDVQWRGGYQSGSGTVTDFTVAIYPSIAGGSQPDVTHAPLVQYQTGDSAGETLAGTVGGIAMYDYHFTLPTAFQATAGTKYWVQIEASQNGIPDWGLAVGTGGDGKHFRGMAVVGDIHYDASAGDAAFTLLGPAVVPIGNLNATNDSPTQLGNVTSLTATIASGSNVSYQWNFGDGALGQRHVVTHTYTTAGFYTAIVTATNSVSVVTATTPITIFSALPLANAGPDQAVAVGAEVTLDGNGSFAPPGHWPLTYVWQQIGGTQVVLNSYTINRPTFIAPAVPTILTFTLVVTDTLALASEPDQVQIDVMPKHYIYLPLIRR